MGAGGPHGSGHAATWPRDRGSVRGVQAARAARMAAGSESRALPRQYNAVDLSALQSAAGGAGGELGGARHAAAVPETDAFEIALQNAWRLSKSKTRQAHGVMLQRDALRRAEGDLRNEALRTPHAVQVPCDVFLESTGGRPTKPECHVCELSTARVFERSKII